MEGRAERRKGSAAEWPSRGKGTVGQRGRGRVSSIRFEESGGSRWGAPVSVQTGSYSGLINEDE